MQIIAIFAVAVVVLNTITVGICSIIERYSEFAGLLAFLGFFVANFVVAWIVALNVTERFLLTDAQRAATAEHMRMLRSTAR